MTPEPRLRSLKVRGCCCCRRRGWLSSNWSPKNLRNNGSPKNGSISGNGFFTVLLVNTFTTLGATFFTTGEKLVVILFSRVTGDSLTTMGTVVLVDFPPDAFSKARVVVTQASAP